MKIVTRGQWRAKPAKSRRTIPLPVKDLFLHHTAGSERGDAGMRAIQAFHQAPRPRGRDWADIAYSWVYDPAGRTFYEARGAGIAGAHTQGHNSTAHALCVMGHFDRLHVPDTLIADLAEFARWHSRYGPGEFTGGHRDVGSTSCPGDNLYRAIPVINAAAKPRQSAPEEDYGMFITTAGTDIVWFVTGNVRVRLAPAKEADELDPKWRDKLRTLSKDHPLFSLEEVKA